MRKSSYVVMILAFGVLLTACGKDGMDEAVRKAEENTRKVEDMEKDEEFVFAKGNNGVILTKYNGRDTHVEIPEEYDGKPVTAVADTAFVNYGNLESITIPYTVSEIDKETLPESEQITLNVYHHSAGEIYAMRRDLPYEYLGENPAQASYVTIYEKEGIDSVTIYPDKEPEEAFLKGVALKAEDGKSVLTLDNCDIGSVYVEEYAALTVEVKEGTTNYITGSKGRDGISSNGSLTITGAGTLNISGSDIYSVGEGDASSVGYGICTYGNLTLENHVQVAAKSGSSTRSPMIGVFIDSGNLIINESKLEAFAVPDGEETVGGASVLVFSYGMEQYGKLELIHAALTEGGQMIPILADEENTFILGYGIGPEAVIAVTTDELLGEFEGYSGAALYTRIEPQLTQE